MQTAADHWTEERESVADGEGWGLYVIETPHGPQYEIQRVDCPEDGSDPMLESDWEAMRHVMRNAAHGSPLHLLALLLDGRAPDDDRIIVAPLESATA